MEDKFVFRGRCLFLKLNLRFSTGATSNRGKESELNMHYLDSELVAAVMDGELHRYGEIVERFDQRVRRTIRRNVSEAALLEDLVQETFYRAFKQLHKLKDPTQLEAWLVTIAHHCVMDHFRQANRRSDRERKAVETQQARQREQAQSAKTRWIWEEVAELSAANMEILRLRYQWALSYQEIANRLGVPESTIRGRIYEARKSLKRRLIDKGLFP